MGLGAVKKAGLKTQIALQQVLPLCNKLTFYAAPGEMGQSLAAEMGFNVFVVGSTGKDTTAKDTENIASLMAKIPVDLLVFAGGDGTARNVCDAIGQTLPVIGIPAGVKIHSAVYATSPLAAGKALCAYFGTAQGTRPAEVMDLDEENYRKGQINTCLYGYMNVPEIRGAMQNPKAASHHKDNDVGGICQEIKSKIDFLGKDCCIIFGAGSTIAAAEKFLGLDGTLLGIDVLQNGKLIAKDATEKTLLQISQKNPCHLFITAIGGQGHIFGRGNQQLSPKVIRQIGTKNICVVAAAAKIFALPQQSLFVDTGDTALDQSLRGYQRVTVGWQEQLVCRVL